MIDHPASMVSFDENVFQKTLYATMKKESFASRRSLSGGKVQKMKWELCEYKIDIQPGQFLKK